MPDTSLDQFTDVAFGLLRAHMIGRLLGGRSFYITCPWGQASDREHPKQRAGAEDAAHSHQALFAGRHVDGQQVRGGARRTGRSRTHGSSRSAKHALY